MKIKTILLVALFLASMLLLTGCWDYIEYEDMAQVYGWGIDFNKDTHEVTLTMQYLSSNQSQSKGNTSKIGGMMQGIVHSAKDVTVIDAVAKMQEVLMDRAFFGYLEVIVVSEEAARYIMKDIIKQTDRTPLIRSTANLLITPGSAEDALRTVDISGEMPSSKEITSLLNNLTLTGVAYPATVEDFAEMLVTEGKDPFAPQIITTHSAKSSSMSEQDIAQGGIQTDIKYDESIDGDHRLAGIAAFKEDGFVGWLNERETMGFGWIMGKRIMNYKTTKSLNKEDTRQILAFKITKSNSKIKAKLNNDKPEIYVNVNVEAELRKYIEAPNTQYLSPEVVKTMEDELAQSVRIDIDAALQKAQRELKSDIFGFGFQLFRKYPKKWRSEYEAKWDKIYPEVPVNVKVDVNVINTGTNTMNIFRGRK